MDEVTSISFEPRLSPVITAYKGKKYRTTPENISRLIEKYTEIGLTCHHASQMIQVQVEATLEPLLVEEVEQDEVELVKLHQKIMNSPHYDEYLEYGRLLMKPIDDLTSTEQERYEELSNMLGLRRKVN